MGEPQTTASPDESKAKRKVKIKLLRPCMIGKDIREAGAVCEVDEETAKELCDRTMPGYHPFYGNMPEIGPLMGEEEVGRPAANPLDRKKIVRAKRI